MRSIIQTSMRFQFLVLTAAAALIVFGMIQFSQMPIDVLPEFSPPYVEIQTEALGLSAKEVEQMITVPMEQDLLAGVAWLDVIRSQSVPGLSSVFVYFEPGTDLFRARQMVAERIAQSAVGLPHVSKPPTMIQPLSSANRFLIVGLSSDNLSLVEMSVLARWTIAPQLMGVPGVAHVAIWGNRDWQLQVLVDPEKLRDQGVTLQQVIETAGNALWVSPLTFLEASTPGTGGFIDTPNQRLTVWHVLPIKSSTDLAQVPVEGTAWKLGEVAQVVEDHQLLIGDAIVNHSPNLMLVIEKLPGTNTLEVTRGIEKALAALKPGLPGIEFNTMLFRPATYLEMAIANLRQSLIIGAVVLALVLGIFFYNWRATIISLTTVVTSMFATLFVLYLRGAMLNSVVLAGLIVALSIVIDEAIMGVENIVRRLRENQARNVPHSNESILLTAIAEIRSPMLFATFIVLLTITPIFYLESISGALLRPLVTSYALAIIVAMIVALTVTPALSWVLFAKSDNGVRESSLAMRLRMDYQKILAKIIHKPSIAFVTLAILITSGLIAIPALGQAQILPTFLEPYLTIKLESVAGTSHPEMNRIITRLSQELAEISGVTNVSAHIGRAIFGDQVVSINSAELWLSMDPKADHNIITKAVKDVIQHYPGLNFVVQSYYQQVLNQPQLASLKDDITLRLYGEDMNILRAEAEKLREEMAGISGIVESHLVLSTEEPALEIEVDLASAQKYGVKPGDVRRSAAILLSGLQVGSLFEEQKVFDVVVWGVPRVRNSLDAIRQLLVDTPGGGHVRLGDVAQVRIVSSPTVIQHDQMSPYIDIGFAVQGRSATAVARDIEAKVKNYVFPLEYHATVLSKAAAEQREQQTIFITSLIAFVGIFLLLQAIARSWSLAFANLLLILAALGGGVIAAALTPSSLSVAALFGLVTILGIASRNSIALLTHYQYLEQEGEIFGPEIILHGASERLTPTLMTTLASGIVLLPLLLFGNIPGQEITVSLTAVIFAGLLISTLLNLFVLPVLYLRFGLKREPDLGLQLAQGADLLATVE